MAEGHAASMYLLLKLRYQDTFLELGFWHITPNSAFVQGHGLYIYDSGLEFLIKSVTHCISLDPNDDGPDHIEVKAERICECKADLYSDIDYLSEHDDIRCDLTDGTDLELKRYNAGKESKAKE